MMPILFNIIRLNDDTIIESLIHKLWATPILMYVSSVYAFCLVAICVCMYFNRRENLIYKVLNLAVLSVFVVALWSYLTDVTFIYVVYILTFVSAVVMLFLSVVLMLPSSAVSVPKKAGSYIVLALITDSTTLFYGVSCIVALLVIYGALAFYVRQPLTENPNSVFLNLDTSELSNQQLAKAKTLLENFTYTAIAIQDSNIFSSPVELDYLARRSSLRGYTGSYPVYLVGTTRILYKHAFLRNSYAQAVLQTVYELVARLTGMATASNALPHRLSKLAGNSNSEMFSAMAKHGVSIRLNGDDAKKVILVLDRPWWSPFVVFPRLGLYTRTFMQNTHFNIPMDSGYRAILDIFLVRPLKSASNYFAQFILAFFSRAKMDLVSSRRFVTAHLLNTSSAVLEIIAQVAASWSIFLLALPSSQFKTTADFSAATVDYHSGSAGLENLANIQYELYVGSPLLMLVCVVGLLVALIGAALLVSTKVLNSK